MKHSIVVVLIIFLGAHAGAQTRARTSAGPLTPPRLAIETEFIDEDSDRALGSEEEGTLTVRVSNEGGEARDVLVRVRSMVAMKGLSIDSTVMVERIGSHKSVEAQFLLLGGGEIGTEKARLLVEADDRSNAGFVSSCVDIPLKPDQPPDLLVGKVLLNGRELRTNNAATAGKKAQLSITIINGRGGKARNVVVRPFTDSPFVLPESQDPIELGDIPPFESRRFVVALSVSDRLKDAAAILTLHVTAQQGNFSRSIEVKIPIIRQ